MRSDMSLGAWLIPYLLLNMALLSAPVPPLSEATFKVGASADDASTSNFGVKVDIETRSYNTTVSTLQYFWVGEELADGAFIQFGYSLEPGVDCLRGAIVAGLFKCQRDSAPISSSDARWQWQYWPDSSKSDFYFEIGPSESAGTNGTVQEYRILPSSEDTWSFMVDGKVIAVTNFSISPSSSPALVIGEATATNETQPLGPVEFSGLSYFDEGNWRMVDSLLAVSYCATSVACAAGQYGAASNGPDSIILGSDVPNAPDGTVLWTNAEEALVVNVHPGAQFFVTTPFGAEAYTGNATVKVPQGMFAYVSLSDTETSSTGILGWLGGQDRFQAWTGGVSSPNATVQILMDSDKNITATWATNTTMPTVVSSIALAIILVTIFAFVRTRIGRPKEPKRPSAEVNESNATLGEGAFYDWSAA